MRMVNQEDRPFALGTNLYPCLERLPTRDPHPEAERAGLVDLGDEEMHEGAAPVDSDPSSIEGGIPVGDRELYVSGHGFGKHYQPQGLTEIPFLRPTEEGQARHPHGEIVDVEVDSGRALDELLSSFLCP